MSQYVDILMNDDDITLDAAGGAIYVTGRASIAQDIKHLIRETGLLVEMIGERDDIALQLKIQQLIIAIEDEPRVVPGTVAITRTDTETLYLTADTELGPIESYINITG